MYSRDIATSRLQSVVLDGLVVFGSALLAVWLRHGAGFFESGSTPWSLYLVPSAVAAIVVVVSLHKMKAYMSGRSLLEEIIVVAKASLAALTLLLAVSFFFREASYSRATVFFFFILVVPLLTMGRQLTHRTRDRLRYHDLAGRRVVVVGFGRVGRQLGEAILQNPAYYTLVGFIDDAPESGAGLPGAPVLGNTGELSEIISSHGVDDVIFAMPSASEDLVQQLIGTCISNDVRWQVVPNVYDLRYERIQLDLIGGLPVFGPRGSHIVGVNWALKRAFDLTVAAVVLILLSPVMLIIALLIKATSQGPILYRHTRIGLNGRPFTMFKFRSMRTDNSGSIHQQYTASWILGRTGEEASISTSGEELAGSDAWDTAQASDDDARSTVAISNGGSTHKITDDPRVTAVGRLIRAASLDELPQLLNVLRGDMSLVGPRPPLPYEVERYTTWHRRRLEVLPGITGLWQVSGRNRLSFEQMVDLDVRYIEEWSLGNDLRIVWRTLPALLVDKGY